MPGRLEADSHKRELVMDLYIVQYCKRSHQNKGQETNKQKQPKTNHKQQTREKWDSYQLLAIMRTMTSCVPSYSMAIKQKQKQTRYENKKGPYCGVREATKHNAETQDPPSQDPRNHKAQPFRHNFSPRHFEANTDDARSQREW